MPPRKQGWRAFVNTMGNAAVAGYKGAKVTAKVSKH